MTKPLLTLCAALLLLPATAFAAPAPSINDEGASVSQEGEVRKLVFNEGDEIDGDSLAPTGEQINAGVRIRHASMISIRENFLAQLVSLTADI